MFHITTWASSTPYSDTYTYDALGNILSKTGQGTYTYGETGYTNPHAPTLIGSLGLSYDNNGNLTSFASTTNSWDYRNRLTTSHSSSSPSTTYGYDHTANRTFKAFQNATTSYPNRYYTVTSATTTKYVYAGDELVATIETVGATSTRQYVHADHLGSTNVLTDSNGLVTRVQDYYPYGSDRVNSGSGGTDRGFIGERKDESTGLSYLNARYYEPGRGQFLSEDPVHWEISITSDGKKALVDPQLQNSYSYARGNPITGKDPDGRSVYFNSRPVGPGIGSYGLASHIYYYVSPESGSAFANIGPFTLGAVPGGAFGTGNLTPTFGMGGSNVDSKYGLSNARQITVPKGQTEDDLIKALYMGHVSVGNAGAKYDAIAGSWGVNSNSYARTLAQFGGILTQFNSYASQFNVGGVNTAPGSGKSVAPPGLAALLFPGMPNFQGTYDFGPSNGGVVDFGKTQSSTPTSKK